MADQKPPRLVGGERETLLALLQYQRESFATRWPASTTKPPGVRSSIDGDTGR